MLCAILGQFQLQIYFQYRNEMPFAVICIATFLRFISAFFNKKHHQMGLGFFFFAYFCTHVFARIPDPLRMNVYL